MKFQYFFYIAIIALFTSCGASTDSGDKTAEIGDTVVLPDEVPDSKSPGDLIKERDVDWHYLTNSIQTIFYNDKESLEVKETQPTEGWFPLKERAKYLAVINANHSRKFFIYTFATEREASAVYRVVKDTFNALRSKPKLHKNSKSYFTLSGISYTRYKNHILINTKECIEDGKKQNTAEVALLAKLYPTMPNDTVYVKNDCGMKGWEAK